MAKFSDVPFKTFNMRFTCRRRDYKKISPVADPAQIKDTNILPFMFL
jgi:hypothetical protein